MLGTGVPPVCCLSRCRSRVPPPCSRSIHRCYTVSVVPLPSTASYSLHFSLFVVCHPRLLLGSSLPSPRDGEPGESAGAGAGAAATASGSPLCPCILHFDSLPGNHDGKVLATSIRRYLSLRRAPTHHKTFLLATRSPHGVGFVCIVNPGTFPRARLPQCLQDSELRAPDQP
jgi:hypothetical protein